MDLTIPTKLMDTIEKAHDTVPEQAYKLATRIASTLTNILNGTGDMVLSPEYEHMLETMALQDIPTIFDTYAQIQTRNKKIKDQADQLLIEQLLTIVRRIEQVKDEYSESLLSEMRTQSRYVQNKFAPKQVDDLDLTVDETYQVQPSSVGAIVDVLKAPVVQTPTTTRSGSTRRKSFFKFGKK